MTREDGCSDDPGETVEVSWPLLIDQVNSANGGMVSEAISLRTADGHRGLFARRCVRPGELLCRVPVTLCWSAEAARERLAPFGLQGPNADQLCPEALISAHLMLEAARVQRLGDGPSSGDACREAHLALLPGSEAIREGCCVPKLPDLPVRWPAEERTARLKGTEAAGVAEGSQRRAYAEWKRLRKMVFSKLPNFFDPQRISFQLFLWAWSLVCSRAMNFPLESAGDLSGRSAMRRHLGSASDGLTLLVPIADFFNHDVDCGSDVPSDPADSAGGDADRTPAEKCAFEEAFYTLAHDAEGIPFIEYKADRCYTAKEEIWNTYGCGLKQASLLGQYGFVPDCQVADEIRVCVPLGNALANSRPLETGDLVGKLQEAELLSFTEAGPVLDVALTSDGETTGEGNGTALPGFQRLLACTRMSVLTSSAAATCGCATCREALESLRRSAGSGAELLGWLRLGAASRPLCQRLEAAARVMARRALAQRREKYGEPAAPASEGDPAAALRRMEVELLRRLDLALDQLCAAPPPADSPPGNRAGAAAAAGSCRPAPLVESQNSHGVLASASAWSDDSEPPAKRRCSEQQSKVTDVPSTVSTSTCVAAFHSD